MGQEQHLAALSRVGRVHAGRRHDRAGLGSHDARDPGSHRARPRRTGLTAHDTVLVAVVRDEAEGLGRDLARDDEDVAVRAGRTPAWPSPTSRTSARSSPVADLGDPGQRRDREGHRHAGARAARSSRARSSAAPAISAAAAHVVHQQRAARRTALERPAARRRVVLVDEPAVEEVGVEPGDGGGRRLDADGRAGRRRRARAPAGRRPAVRPRRREPRVPRSASRTPGHAEDDADRDDRVARRQQHHVGVADRVEHAGGGGRPVDARRRRTAAPGTRGPQPHPPLLEVDRALARPSLASTTTWVSTGVVGHRQQPDPLVGQAPAGASASVTSAERAALAEPLACGRCGCRSRGRRARTTAAARRTPRARPARAWRLVGAAPALALVDAAAEGVHHGVQVGTDPQPEQGDVVAGVADDGDLGVGERVGAGVEVGAQAAQEPGAADAAGQGRDAHAAQSLSPEARPAASRDGRRRRRRLRTPVQIVTRRASRHR